MILNPKNGALLAAEPLSPKPSREEMWRQLPEMLYEVMRPMKAVFKIRKTSVLWALDQAKQFMMATFPGLF